MCVCMCACVCVSEFILIKVRGHNYYELNYIYRESYGI